MRFTPNVTGAETSPHSSAKSTSGATPFGHTQYSMMGGPPSVRGVNVVNDGRMSQPCARWTMSSIGCPGPIGSSPGGGSGCISGMTGLTDNSGGTWCSGSASVTAARTAVRSPCLSSTSMRLTRRPRLRTVVITRIGPGSGAHRKLPLTAMGSTPSACSMRAAFAHSASIAPPWTFGPMVQCSFSSPSYTPSPAGVSAMASVNKVEFMSRCPPGTFTASAQQVGPGELQRFLQQRFAFGSRAHARCGHLEDHMPRKVAGGQRLADLNGGLGAAARDQVLVGGGAAAVAQVQMYESVAHPAGHVNRVGACGRGVRQVERVVGVIAVQRVVGRRERRDAGAGLAATLAHPLDRRLARAEETVGAKGKHVLHGHHDVAGRLELGDLIGEALGVAALPTKRRMHDNRLRAELFGRPHTAVQLRDRVGASYPLRDQQAGCVHRQHRHVVAH